MSKKEFGIEKIKDIRRQALMRNPRLNEKLKEVVNVVSFNVAVYVGATICIFSLCVLDLKAIEKFMGLLGCVVFAYWLYLFALPEITINKKKLFFSLFDETDLLEQEKPGYKNEIAKLIKEEEEKIVRMRVENEEVQEFLQRYQDN